ncbi:hypothetical protein UA45_10380 [Morganella morganii]|uniref:Uncharacterized protein n=1 Tax=Morganella morganii TaxID=582 RepID=A0A0D8L7G2_MORMO|nr:hypothetical protein UA45_10380 [Morganella morganii]
MLNYCAIILSDITVTVFSVAHFATIAAVIRLLPDIQQNYHVLKSNCASVTDTDRKSAHRRKGPYTLRFFQRHTGKNFIFQ